MAERFTVSISAKGEPVEIWPWNHQAICKIGTGTSKEKNGTGRFLNQYKMVCSIIFIEWVRHIFAFSDSLTSCQPTMSSVACRVYSPKVYHTSGPWKMVVGRLYTFLLGRSFFRGYVGLGEGILNWIPISLHQYHHLSLWTFGAFFSSNGHGYLYTWMYFIS